LTSGEILQILFSKYENYIYNNFLKLYIGKNIWKFLINVGNKITYNNLSNKFLKINSHKNNF